MDTGGTRPGGLPAVKWCHLKERRASHRVAFAQALGQPVPAQRERLVLPRRLGLAPVQALLLLGQANFQLLDFWTPKMEFCFIANTAGCQV